MYINSPVRKIEMDSQTCSDNTCFRMNYYDCFHFKHTLSPVFSTPYPEPEPYTSRLVDCPLLDMKNWSFYYWIVRINSLKNSKIPVQVEGTFGGHQCQPTTLSPILIVNHYQKSQSFGHSSAWSYCQLSWMTLNDLNLTLYEFIWPHMR